MCGIFGYANFNAPRSVEHVMSILFGGLQHLEYRGYDSAGICVDVPAKAGPGVVPEVIKSSGKIVDLQRLAFEQLTASQIEKQSILVNSVGIGHTRWATHGPPTATNSHPHVSDDKRDFVVVHNGIITNYAVLKEFLSKQGLKFESDTDTEVVPKLYKYLYDQHGANRVSFPKLTMEVMSRLDGAFALLIKSTHYPNEVIAAKRGSPLIFGSCAEEVDAQDVGAAGFDEAGGFSGPSLAVEAYLASDPGAIIPYTNKVIMLEDNDVLHLVNGSYGIYNTASLQEDLNVDRTLQTLQMQVEQIMKGGFDHFMQKEIFEQPDTVAQTMGGRVLLESVEASGVFSYPSVKLGGLQGHLEALRACRRLMFVACGTSYNACLTSRPLLEEMAGVPVQLELASDLLDRQAPVFRDDAVFFVSQSGETADTLMALEYAKEKGALCVGITNTVGSTISRLTHCGVHLSCGIEIGVASTKAYTSQIVSLVMIALTIGQDSLSKSNRRMSIIRELGTLPDRLRESLKLDGEIRRLAALLKDVDSMLFFARGINYATALEAALKVKEVSLIHSEGMSAGEMKHGPLALVDEHMPIVVIATMDAMHRKMESVIQQLLARNARLIVVCNDGDKSMNQYAAKNVTLIKVPRVIDVLQPVVNIIPLQLLSYHLTVLRGFNVDQPRNLAKSVTVTEE